MHPDQWKILHAGELAFFARISASISHEIKNHLAIINEQNGLMGDLLAMAAKGGALPATRLHGVVKDIARQVTLTDTIVRRFNVFAHTADSALETVDAVDYLSLLAHIAGRLARLKEKALVVDDGLEHVMIRTHPFEFLHILYVCLNMLLNDGAQGDAVALGLRTETGRVQVFLTASGGLAEDQITLQDQIPRLLLNRLQATCGVDRDASRVVLTFPEDLDPKLD